MEFFMPIFDFFVGETQVEISKSVLNSFAKHSNETSDPLIVNTVLSIGKTVHDSLNALSFQDETRQLSQNLCGFIRKVNFGMEFDKQLNFYIECRRNFGNLDPVKYLLVTSASSLAAKTLKVVKRKHSSKTSAFVRSCISFCYITIPSMEDYFGRLNLYLISAQTALMNNALPQAESLFKAAIKLIQEVPNKLEMEGQSKSTEENLIQFINNFCSALVSCPGHPEFGPFYLIKGFIKVVSEYPWETGSTAKARIFLTLLSMFSSLSQKSLPYHIYGVEGNDVLYGGDPDYNAEIQVIINKLLEDMLAEITNACPVEEGSTPTPQQQKNQAKLSLDLANYVLAFAEITAKSASLIYQLISVARKSQIQDLQPYLSNTLKYIQLKENGIAKELYKKLSS